LLFQILDSKTECAAIYADGKIATIYDDAKFTATWAPTLHFKDHIVDCANIWAQGKSLNEVCPEALKEEWQMVNKKAASYLNSFHKSKIDLEDNCFYDLLPDKFLLQFYDLKNKITDYVFNTYTKPENHNFMFELILFLKKIENQRLNLNFKNLDMSVIKTRKVVSKIKYSPHHIDYNPWGTVTGRLTTNKNSFPILTLNKELRSVLQPNNECFFELDFNAAEIRVLFSLLGQEQPDIDVHSWIAENIFDGKFNREQTKKKVFAWLYNPKARNKRLNTYLNRDELYSRYYKNGRVETPFGRSILAQEDKAINYLIQSTASDLFLTSVLKVDKMLTDKNSNVCFCVHDSLILDCSKNDRSIINDIVHEFSNTKFGFFKTNLSMGKNYGAMEKIE
tara:strand:- start:1190 stop:2368 length:1179 start_codon:yes stop_codon:yes gene_type:complete